MANTRSEKQDFIPFVSELETSIPTSASAFATGAASLFNCVVNSYKGANDVIRRKVSRRPYIVSQETNAGGVYRGMFYDNNSNKLWEVKGANVYINGTSTITLASSTGEVFIDYYRYGSTNGILVIEAGSNMKVSLYNNVGTLQSSVSTGINSTIPPVILDGYVFIVANDTQRIYNSNVGNPTAFTTANDYIDAEMKGDTIRNIAKYKNYLVVFGLFSIEFFYNAAVDVGSPIRRQTQYAKDLGIIKRTNPRYNFIETPNGLAWISSTLNGSHGVFILNNFTPQKISTPYIDNLLQSSVFQTTTFGEDIKLFLFGYQGRDFYLLSIPHIDSDTIPALFVYDVQEDLWYEWELKLGTGSTSVLYSVNSLVYNVLAVTDGTTEYSLYLDSYSNAAGNFETYDYSNAFIITDSFNFGSDLYKHIKTVDIIGKVPDSTSITLYYTSDSDLSSWTQHSTKTKASAGKTQQMRWLNLGRHPRIALKCEISGTADFLLDGASITYTEGIR